MPPTDTTLRVVASTDRDTADAAPQPTPKLGLSLLDEVALTAGAPDLEADLVSETKELATALADKDAGPARVRTISRVVAIEKARHQLLQARAGALVAAGQIDAAIKIDKLITGSIRRLERFIRLHRDEGRGTPPNAMVLIGHADRVDLSEKT